jgi:hypothetical protein
MDTLQIDLDNLAPRDLLTVQLAVECIIEAAKIGSPSSVVYLAMSHHGMSLSTYTALLDCLQQLGQIEVVNHQIRIPLALAA